MIVTLTPNPSLDRALDLPRLEPGGVNRALAEHLHPGGKGLNVTRALTANGVASRAVLPVGGPDGDRMVALLADQQVAAHPVRVAGHTRTNLTLAEVTGRTTKVNSPGVALSAAETDALLAAVQGELLPDARALVIAGSLAAGQSMELLTRAIDLAAEARVPVVVDTSGAPLAAAVAHGGLSLIKPNDEELAELTGARLDTVGDVLAAARGLIAGGLDTVLVSLGGHGALLVQADRSWWAGGPALVPLSTVGAGDCTLAGYLAADDPDPGARLARAVAWGRAAVLLPGSAVPAPTDIHPTEVAVVADPDPATALKELSS
ncbi:1-phosphofructokinase family hexose kinase [Cellulomonas denverensis]|uniref:1-phosphofructokinase family hexose kinase n=1 Tax=Cellulomonas denverensis TaxID=264297 RepID=A0A7X6KVL2_9CELL|nr:1-phosphofructokinase family hexose kinase [Cellulomonas denverensis]NKY23091.1 1-phosphofructokinase family hexose kinase [Cellulomonas denverensis]GIG23828.1 1-phosphofructokinase [Cellulomonas denverensis]